MSTTWSALVSGRCPPGSAIDQRCFRLAPTDRTGGDLRSGLYAGVFTRMPRCSVPRWVCAWVLRGTGTYAMDGVQHRFGPGDVFQRFPDQHHDLLFDDPAAGCYWFAGLPPGCLAAVRACGLAAQTSPVLSVGCDTALLRRAFAFHDALLRTADDDLAPAMAEAFALCIILLRSDA
ncbi:MAG: hypothetical protein J0M02_09580, partial [Planctomycetes bacterium]|nr:hypothetical protein [Planctomycetota bacterium]